MSDWDKFREKMEEHRELLEEVRETTSFSECVAIKEAGEEYRELGSIEDVAEAQDIGEEEAERLIRYYLVLVNEPTDMARTMSMLRGVRFYGGQKSLEEIAEDSEDSIEDIQNGIREFVGMTLEERDSYEGDLSPSLIPDEAVYPPSFTEAISGLQNTLSDAVQSVSESISIPRETFADIRSMNERLDQALRESLQPTISTFSKVIEDLREQVSVAIRDGISNFESPEEYEPGEVYVNPMAQEVAVSSLERFIEEMEQVDSDALNSYLPRLRAVIAGFEEESYYTPIFVAISVQDGLMQYICEEEGVSPDYTSRFGDDVYKWDTKRDTLAQKYEGWYNVDTGEVIPNLDSFYQHRNTIMHGDPLAFFDKNIATISLLFLNLTIYTVIEAIEDESDSSQ